MTIFNCLDKKREKDDDEPDKKSKKEEPEPDFMMIENPARVMPAQLKKLSLPNDCRYQPLKSVSIKVFNPFHATDLFWCPLKTSENLWFSDVFRGYQKRSVAWNGLIVFIAYTKKYLQSDWLREYNISRICTLFSIFVLFE